MNAHPAPTCTLWKRVENKMESDEGESAIIEEPHGAGLVEQWWTAPKTEAATDLQGWAERDDGVRAVVDEMVIRRVCEGALGFAVRLEDDWSAGKMRCGRGGGEDLAVRAVEKVVVLLTRVVRVDGVGEGLERVREVVRRRVGLRVGRGGLGGARSGVRRRKLSETTVGTATLAHDRMGMGDVEARIREVSRYLDPDDREVVLLVAELAKALRVLAATVGIGTHPEINDTLASERRSIGDVAVIGRIHQLVDWSEDLAAYPFRISDLDSAKFAMSSSAMSDELRQRPRRREEGEEDNKGIVDIRSGEVSSTQLPAKEVGWVKSWRAWAGFYPLRISTGRYYAALIAGVILGYLTEEKKSSTSAFVVQNNPATLGSSSSFVEFLSHLHRRQEPLDMLLSLLTQASSTSIPITTTTTTALPSLKQRPIPTDLWPKAKTSLLRRGHTHALFISLLAILTHHIRRILLPGLGQTLRHTPLSDLKLSARSPAYFVDEALSNVTWGRAILVVVQNYVFDHVVGYVSLSILVQDAEFKMQSHNMYGPAVGGGRVVAAAQQQRFPRPVLDVAQILYIAWILAGLEHFLSEAATAASFAMAYAKLLLPSIAPASHTACLVRTLRSKAHILPLHILSLVYACVSVGGLVSVGVKAAVERGRVGLLASCVSLAVGTAYVTRFSNKLYMALEMRDMFLVGGLCVCAVVVLAREFFA